MNALRLPAVGPFAGATVRVVASTFAADVRADAAAWGEAKRRLGDKLFDGPMCRYERFSVVGDRLELDVSRTSYRVFVETNLYGPRDLPPSALARPVGVSAALETADGKLVLGRRGGGVAYYPNRVHPFAGSLEWPDSGDAIDPFAECRRELAEELGLADADVPDLALTGVAEDADLRHPELIFTARTTLAVADLRRQLDDAEHRDLVALETTPDALAAALRGPDLTPIARASVLLWGGLRFGGDWRADQRRELGV